MERGSLSFLSPPSLLDRLSLQQAVDSNQFVDYFWKEKVYIFYPTVRLKIK